MLRSGYWRDRTWRELAGLDQDRTIALLPVAAVEQHGPHLPLATDAIIAENIVAEVLRHIPSGLTLLALPTLSIGHSPEHAAYPGTLTTTAETLLALWTDVGRSVARAGVRKVVILNSHGGQESIVDIAALRMRAEEEMLVVRANYCAFGVPPGLFDADEIAHGIHGGEVETSLMLHLRPELVRREEMRDFDGLPARMARKNVLLGTERPAGFAWMSQDLHPEGIVGNAHRAGAERGALLFEHIVKHMVRLLEEVAETPLEIIRPGPGPVRR